MKENETPSELPKHIQIRQQRKFKKPLAIIGVQVEVSALNKEQPPQFKHCKITLENLAQLDQLRINQDLAMQGQFQNGMLLAQPAIDAQLIGYLIEEFFLEKDELQD